MSGTEAPSPFLEFDRASWARLREHEPMALTQADVDRISGLGEEMDLAEVEDIYLPLSRLLTYYVNATAGLHAATSEFLGERPERTPFVIGVAGSVAVGKSTTSRVLREVMRHWEATPNVTLVTTDGFLYPNEVLEERGLLNRKGFPESYDRRALVRFVAEVKAGKEVVTAPVYSHKTYDIVPGERIEVRRPDVLIIEGLNILQPPRKSFDGRRGLTVSDFVDFSVYVDARIEDIKTWYLSRFLQLRDTAFADPNAYFHRYANLTDETAVAIAETVWGAINEPNLKENVLPTRSRATCVLTKGADHAVRRVRLRKI